jgi:hypothetical protein
MAEAFALQPAQRTAQQADLVAHHMRSEIAIGPILVALDAERLRHVEHDRDRQRMMLAREIDQQAAILRPHAGRVDHRQATGRQALAGKVKQHIEGVRGRALVHLVIGDPAAHAIRGNDLGRQEVPRGEAGLAGAGGTDQGDQREIGNPQLHVKTPICVEVPSSRSTSPMPSKRTA